MYNIVSALSFGNRQWVVRKVLSRSLSPFLLWAHLVALSITEPTPSKVTTSCQRAWGENATTAKDKQKAIFKGDSFTRNPHFHKSLFRRQINTVWESMLAIILQDFLYCSNSFTIRICMIHLLSLCPKKIIRNKHQILIL